MQASHAVALTMTMLLLAQASSGQAPPKREFEVASVKRNTTNGPSDMRGPRRSGDLITMHNTQPYSVVFYAFGLTGSYQLVGYPDLPADWRWVDIDARAGAGATDDDVRLMMQSLLEDRFKLKAHRETRSLPEYELTIAKTKPKLTPAREGAMTVTIEGKSFPTRPGTCSTTLWVEGAHLVCHGAGVDKIVDQLSGTLQSPVADRTGLTGTYDLNVLYLPDGRKLDPDAPSRPIAPRCDPGGIGTQAGKRERTGRGAGHRPPRKAVGKLM